MVDLTEFVFYLFFCEILYAQYDSNFLPIPGSIVAVFPDQIYAKDEVAKRASFTGVHVCHGATRGVGGTAAQPALPTLYLSLLPVLQVSWGFFCETLSYFTLFS